MMRRNYAKPTLSNAFVANKAPEQIALGDAEKMATQLKMQIATRTWVKEIHAEQQQLTLVERWANLHSPTLKLVLAVGANPIRLAHFVGDGSDDIQVVLTI